VGSTPIARYIYTNGTANGKRVQALGGAKNFVLVMPDADMARAASISTESCFGCAGERCLANSVVLAVGDAYEAMRTRLVDEAKKIRVGDGLEPGVSMGPVITAAHREKVLGYIEKGIAEGATLALDGRGYKDPKHPEGYFLGPTIFTDVKPGMVIAEEEIFGPVLCVMKAATFEEAVEIVKRHDLGNASSIFTSSGKYAREYRYRVEPSMLGVNIGVAAPMAYFPFGGARDSFFGDLKVHGRDAFAFADPAFMRVKEQAALILLPHRPDLAPAVLHALDDACMATAQILIDILRRNGHQDLAEQANRRWFDSMDLLHVAHSVKQMDEEMNDSIATIASSSTPAILTLSQQRRLRELGSFLETLNLNDTSKKEGALSEDAAKALAQWLKETLGDKVGEVRSSRRLVESPAVIVDADKFMTSSMRRIMKAMKKDGDEPGMTRQDLEINPAHPIISRLDTMRQKDPALAGKVAEQILDNARVAAGLLDDPRTMLTRLNQLLEKVLAGN
jgi:hypothetical protein